MEKVAVTTVPSEDALQQADSVRQEERALALSDGATESLQKSFV
jgi:hypothetical protein